MNMYRRLGPFERSGTAGRGSMAAVPSSAWPVARGVWSTAVRGAPQCGRAVQALVLCQPLLVVFRTPVFCVRINLNILKQRSVMVSRMARVSRREIEKSIGCAVSMVQLVSQLPKGRDG